jgi:hypothetical protein
VPAVEARGAGGHVFRTDVLWKVVWEGCLSFASASPSWS